MYFHEGHHTFSVPHGGYVGSNESVNNRNFSFKGNNNDTYLSLYPGPNTSILLMKQLFLNDSADIVIFLIMRRFFY